MIDSRKLDAMQDPRKEELKEAYLEAGGSAFVFSLASYQEIVDYLKGMRQMKKGNLYESSDGDVYEVIEIGFGDVTVKVVQESTTRRPDPLGTERTWFAADLEQMIEDGDFWQVSQIPIRAEK
jgi:hypothetical protein